MNSELERIAQGISSMEIRGAGRIAVASASALRSVANASTAGTVEEFSSEVKHAARRLVETRPTAVSLPNAMRYVIRHGLNGDMSSVEDARTSVIKAADDFIENANNALHLIGEFGSRRILDGEKVLTVCNSNAAIEVMRHAAAQGKDIEVFAMETRPRFQGRLTATALAEAGITVNLIVDSAARYYVREVDHVIVGADAITANGAVVNKIGTATAALAAHEARTRVSVAAETFKFHPDTVVGELVEIEERDPNEVLPASDHIDGVRVRNPVFDITPSEYIDIIVTERGVIPPQASFYLLTNLFGWHLTERDPWEQ
ncbi:ribose 1,5-bisphosphate isomerase [archaeon]|nr:MAG: ribose 1,5-bisphosphate isomerase [archaeon]